MNYKIWYLKHPLTLYKESKEEIKKLAKDGGFRIIDAKFGSNDEKTPKLTLVDAQKSKPRKPKTEKVEPVIVKDITED